MSLSPSPSVVTTQEDALAVVEELMEHIKVQHYTFAARPVARMTSICTVHDVVVMYNMYHI